MTLRNDHPPLTKFRNAVALLHPGSAIRFVLDDGTELELVAYEKTQAHRESEKGNDVPTAAPSMTVHLRRMVPMSRASRIAAENVFDKIETVKAVRHLEKAPPNSGGES